MGKEIYSLHDNGRKLFTSPQDCTPIQRYVYVMAKDHHTDDPDAGSPNPHGMQHGQDIKNHTSKFV